ncbi:MAG: class I tRNA ligase family protein [bacterium]|nr:class I tRNA ligase family protein [bacterium]
MYDFKKTEQEILKFWRDNNIFEKSLEAKEKAKRFVFFEGPPTANGKPGIHHFLGRAFKDLFCRYKTMRGFFVLRKAGWDTHGLPVEIEIEKELGFKNKKDIENYGIDKFNKKAKESVWKYKTEWEEMTRKMGFWVDLKDPYITYENNYIESLWHIIQKIWKKKLLYFAHKVVPFCTRCGTSLSSHEVAQGYKTVKDKSITVKFPISNFQFPNKLQIPKNSKLFILAWTTTPWTLPGNVALAVGGSIKYQVVSIKGKDEKYILAEDLVSKALNTEYIIHNTILGSDLVGLEYEPLFDIKDLKSKNSYKIYDADFVSTEEGTGVVHTAVMYGEDDYELGTKLDLPKFHTVDEQGKFTNVNEDLNGKYVKSKEAEDLIIQHLTTNNLLLTTSEYEHDYPFCWRCDSPLLYYAKSSWFIKMSAVREQLLKNNQKINWFPEHIKDGRFGQWLKEGKDWAFSRERYWGTPLPIWKCQKCDHYKVIGSVAEMEKQGAPSKTKKNTYYILRHGYTTRDERGKGIISTDIKLDKYHLTSEGIKQAENNAEKINNNYKIDIVYSSPFIRTVETAETVAKLLHLNVNKDDRIREIGHGDCDAKPHSECGAEDSRRTVDAKPHELGESWNEVRTRMMDFMQDMESKYSGKNILIVSHGDPLWILKCIAEGNTGQEIEDNLRKEFYPEIAGFSELKWRALPRNSYGELDLHRPYIDNIYLKCDECGASMKKVPDLIDAWFDSGAMPYAQWHWPFKNQNEKIKNQNFGFKNQYPADFISEAIDQTRGWFYTLLAVSTLLGKRNPYKNVICYGHVLDEKGKKMSKSKGNTISPFDVMDKVGADTARWYFYTINQPGEYKMFAMKDVEAKLKGFIFTLQNCVRFYELYSEEAESWTHSAKATNLLDKWILSRFNGLVFEVSENLDKYDPTTAARIIEKFVIEELSNWWLRRSRKRKEALGLLRFLLLELAKVLAPFTPFIAEDIHTRMHKGQKMGTESVHLHDWPKVDKKLIDKKLEDEMEEVRSIVTTGLAVRKEKQIKVRQPLRLATVKRISKLENDLGELIKEELNVKNLVYDNTQETLVILDTELDQLLLNEGYARELIRQIQDMRKEAKYKMDDKVYGQWHSDDKDLSEAIRQWSDEIKNEALLSDFVNRQKANKTYDVEKEFELAPQTPHQANPLTTNRGGGLGAGRGKIWVGIRK